MRQEINVKREVIHTARQKRTLGLPCEFITNYCYPLDGPTRLEVR
jgi:hypothetical protein